MTINAVAEVSFTGGAARLHCPMMRALLLSFLDDTSATAAAEYAMILAIVGAALTAAALSLGGAISTAVTTAATNMAWH